MAELEDILNEDRENWDDIGDVNKSLCIYLGIHEKRAQIQR